MRLFAAPSLFLCYNGYIMKISIASDVHLEFGDFDIQNTDNADVLILSGDICVNVDMKEHDPYGVMEGTRSSRYHDFFQRCAEKFNHVVYVAGNHEHYNGDFKYTLSDLKSKLAYIKNLYVLDREVKKIDDITFVGGTLWTDMNKEDPLTLFHMKDMMNDFRCVQNSNRMVSRKVPIYELNPNYTEDGKNGGKYITNENGAYIPSGYKHKDEPARFCAEDAVEDHKKMLGYIQVVTDFLGENPDKYVVVGHHAPSRRSTHPRYKHDTIMNGGYSSSLDEFIESRPCIKLWTHGHTHEPFDYMIGETRVVCNPRGYIGHEARAREFTLKTVEV